MDARQILEQINSYLIDIMQFDNGNSEFVFPVNIEDVENQELREICRRLTLFFNMITEASDYADQLAQGNLQVKASRNNIIAMPLKGLQASLANLTWQVNQVASGDLSQQLYFLGEFSHSFNHMIDSLREKQVLEQRLKIITELVGEGIILADSEGRIVFANPEALKLLEYSFTEIKNAFMHELISKQSSEYPLDRTGGNLLLEAIKEGREYQEDKRFITCKSGLLIPVLLICRPVYKNDSPDGAVIAFRDITEQNKYLHSLETINKSLENQATTDPLTGIYNRMKFNDILKREMLRSKRSTASLSLIMCDIDHFKRVNDTFGHSAGDAVLKRLSKLVSESIRKIDCFARWGGEEFVILLPDTASGGAVQTAEKLRKKVESFNFIEPETITLSFGVSHFSPDDNRAEFINRADKALYAAKGSGRNRVRYLAPAGPENNGGERLIYEPPE
ncbi:MAG: hypothetical protein B6241_15205 [Spirochaetaceae bacterium 4572_59]|nr:MAG: hypothetical protein B6241_15205 [Spirochaetaceae bacterium 4572_59]